MSNGSQFLIAVCDDDRQDRESMTHLARTYYSSENVEYSIKMYDSGTDLLSAIDSGERFNLLVLDVMMDSLDGISLASVLRRKKDDTTIVFMSSNLEMALQGYEVAAARYLSKPLKQEKVNEALSYAYRHFQDNREVLLPTTQGLRRIAPMDILYVEATERGSRVILANERIDTSLRIFEQENLLPRNQFILCHRAFVVNLAAVRSIRRYELELNDGKVVPVSKHRFAFVKDRLVDYLKI